MSQNLFVKPPCTSDLTRGATLPEPRQQKRPMPLYQSFNPLDYRIHIGWFGGVHIYKAPKS